MKRWYRYRRHLLSGLWHVHTDRTDGRDAVDELLAFAEAHGFPLVAIVEHVRRELTYDFDALYDEATTLAADRDLTCLVGCEAKVLDGEGSLDADAATLARADVVYAAYHGTPFSRKAYLDSIPAMLANQDVDVWAHPFAYAAERGFVVEEDQLDHLLAAVGANDVLYELNLRRPASEIVSWRQLAGVPKVVGFDLHDLEHWTSPGVGLATRGSVP